MLKGLLARHRALRLGASLVGASVLAVGFASPAFATQATGGNTSAKNYLIIDGGSNTTYLMMTALSNIFNEAPGCDLATASGIGSLGQQPLDYGCPGIGTEVGTQQSGGAAGVGENGFVPFGQENPFNDILVNEPALGSSNGIAELENQGTHGGASGAAPTAPLDFARSSRAPKLTSTSSAGDDKGLNFGPYAMDGVSWFHWTKVGATATPSANVKNLTVAQLTSIWEGTVSCVSGTTTLHNNWKCLGGTAAPIALYIAQSGSGTESTWASLLGLPSTGFPYGGENNAHIIFENETESIIANKDEKNAIFFFSYGKFKTVCQPTKGYCGAKPTGFTGGTIALGEINSITVSSTTIAAQLPGSTTTPFPGDRLLYNVYSDGSNSDIPMSSLASLNAVSEDGFLCKNSTTSDIDPNTGVAYRTEINNTITAQGFFPLATAGAGIIEDGNGDTTPPFNTTVSGITTPAWTGGTGTDGLGGSVYDAAVEAAAPYNYVTGNQDTDNSAVSGSHTLASGTSATATPTNPIGFCLVLTTDANSTP